MSENAPKKPEIVSVPGSPDPSYPDRQRIDSDVRAFLREPSTPWIVFDKDSRVDHAELQKSYLSAGQFLLQSSRKSVLNEEAFKAAPVAEPVVETKPEPSGLAVASDIEIPEAVPTVRPMSIDIEVDEADEVDAAHSLPLVARGGLMKSHTTWLAIAGGATACVVATVLAFGGGASHKAETKAAAAKTEAPVAAPAPAREEIPPPAAASDDEKDAKVEAATPATKVEKIETKSASKIEKPHSKFGRFVIAGDARYKNVFFDGKRMLGKGTRSFAVLCGTHNLAVNDRADVREIDVPCDGEYAVTK